MILPERCDDSMRAATYHVSEWVSHAVQCSAAEQSESQLTSRSGLQQPEVELGRAERSRAEQSRAEGGGTARAEQSRAVSSCCDRSAFLAIQVLVVGGVLL